MPEIGTLIEHFPYLGIFVLLILGGIGLPFPEDTTLLLSGFLVAHEVIAPVPAFFVVYAAVLSSDFFLYGVGRQYGRKVVEHKRFRKIISPERLSKIEERFRKSGVWVILIGRHLLGLRAQIFLVAGVLRMSPLKFLVADAVSALFTIALMGGIGYFGGSSIQVLRQDVTRIDHIAILVLIILFVIGILFWYLRNRQKVRGK